MISGMAQRCGSQFETGAAIESAGMNLAQSDIGLNQEARKINVRAWLEEVKRILVQEYELSDRDVRQMDMKQYSEHCASGLSPSEAVMAEYFHDVYEWVN